MSPTIFYAAIFFILLAAFSSLPGMGAVGSLADGALQVIVSIAFLVLSAAGLLLAGAFPMLLAGPGGLFILLLLLLFLWRGNLDFNMVLVSLLAFALLIAAV